MKNFMFLVYVCGLNKTAVWKVNQDTLTSVFSLFGDSVVGNKMYKRETSLDHFFDSKMK
jgi:hypothetical protein